MAEYIDREAALEALSNPFTMRALSMDELKGMRLAQEMNRVVIAHIPAADVVEVRRGRWLSMDSEKVIAMDDDGCPVDSCRCSECGDWLTASDEFAVRGRYCPNCGAKMAVDGE